MIWPTWIICAFCLLLTHSLSTTGS